MAAIQNPRVDLGARVRQNVSQSVKQSVTDFSQIAKAATPAKAQQMANDVSVSRLSLRWTQFVQKSQTLPRAVLERLGEKPGEKRGGTSGPKGQLGLLLESKASEAAQKGDLPSLLYSTGKTQGKAQPLSSDQKSLLLQLTFGKELGSQMSKVGISDPFSFLSAGALPEGRATLAGALNIPRARLLAILMRAELLKIGMGPRGQLGITPDLLRPLAQSGIAMLGTMSAMRGFSQDELSYFYKLLRHSSGGFNQALMGGRPAVKRDLLHWARSAGKNPSQILLRAHLDPGAALDHGDAQEMVQAWYLENLLWQELLNARKQRDAEWEREHQRREREAREEEERRESDAEQEEDEYPALIYDPERSDQLVCFWITDFNVDPTSPSTMRRMYVCIDPDSGAIIPQNIEADIRQTG